MIKVLEIYKDSVDTYPYLIMLVKVDDTTAKSIKQLRRISDACNIDDVLELLAKQNVYGYSVEASDVREAINTGKYVMSGDNGDVIIVIRDVEFLKPLI